MFQIFLLWDCELIREFEWGRWESLLRSRFRILWVGLRLDLDVGGCLLYYRQEIVKQCYFIAKNFWLCRLQVRGAMRNKRLDSQLKFPSIQFIFVYNLSKSYSILFIVSLCRRKFGLESIIIKYSRLSMSCWLRWK